MFPLGAYVLFFFYWKFRMRVSTYFRPLLVKRVHGVVCCGAKRRVFSIAGGDSQRRAPDVLRVQQGILWQEQAAAPFQPSQHTYGGEAFLLPLLPPQSQPQG